MCSCETKQPALINKFLHLDADELIQCDNGKYAFNYFYNAFEHEHRFHRTYKKDVYTKPDIDIFVSSGKFTEYMKEYIEITNKEKLNFVKSSYIIGFKPYKDIFDLDTFQLFCESALSQGEIKKSDVIVFENYHVIINDLTFRKVIKGDYIEYSIRKENI